MAKQFLSFATTCFLLAAFTSHCYAVTCVTLTGAQKPPTVVAKLEPLENHCQNSRSIDEPLLAAIDGGSDGFLNSSKNTTNGVNLVDAEYYYLSNRLGSISAILDADNQDRILEYYRYEVFGSATVLPIVDNNTDGLEDTPLDLNDNNASGATLVSSFGNTYLYTARRFDDVTGLYYYRNRYYDPRSGRFITRTDHGGSNLYVYILNRSIFSGDPLGNPGGLGGGLNLVPKEEAEKNADEARGAVAGVLRWLGGLIDSAAGANREEGINVEKGSKNFGDQLADKIREKSADKEIHDEGEKTGEKIAEVASLVGGAASVGKSLAKGLSKKVVRKVGREVGEEVVDKARREIIEQAAERAARQAVKKRMARIALCESIHAAYSALKCVKCTSCMGNQETIKQIACWHAEVIGRRAWIQSKCYYFTSRSIARGSRSAELGHIQQLREKTKALGKCVVLQLTRRKL